MQIAYVTDDLERSVQAFSRTFGVLAWAAVRPVLIEEPFAASSAMRP